MSTSGRLAGDEGTPSSESLTGVRLPRTGAEHRGIAPGALIAERYRIERILGEGAMGIVYAARHVELDELVAIKCIRSAVPWSPDVIARFAREAKACARLKNEHVAKVIDVGVSAPVGPYMVMEYLEGLDLAAVLRQRGPLSTRRAAEYVMQVCEALAVAHAASITHRDVKPENLFLTRHGELEIIKVLDFGISKAPPSGRLFGSELAVRETSSLMGTPLYMSPEQIRSTREVDHRTDLWSLGVVLFELLTGRPAFAGETVTQVCALVLEAGAPSLTEHCHGAPDGLARVLERCLKKDPAERYQSAAELAHALLPFAPPRARLHAERATAVLDAAAPDSEGEPLPSTVPEGRKRQSMGTAAPTVLGAGVSARASGRRTRKAILITSLCSIALGFFGWRAMRGSGDATALDTAAAATLAVGDPDRMPAPSGVPSGGAPAQAPPSANQPLPEPVTFDKLPPATKAARRHDKPGSARPPARPPAAAPSVKTGASESGTPAANEPKPAPDAEPRPTPSRARLIDEASRVRLLE